jgi:hypothetical protein
MEKQQTLHNEQGKCSGNVVGYSDGICHVQSRVFLGRISSGNRQNIPRIRTYWIYESDSWIAMLPFR